ncbi:2-dehydropantoate 2-reductase [Pseudonocardia acaciae]|uniref:2-dehydropantoate 2-reductase n=1 Tax=Pseudonocardia acaciae TaxID=551276 RepID=UPI000688193B|nr:2-dehydropantoate 2-reductase [Pseudonocardia acaciae]
MPRTSDSDPEHAASVAVVGLGAIGGMLAADAADAGHRVTACVRTPFDKFVLDQDGTRRIVPVTVATDPDQVEPVDWLVVATKAQDTAASAPWLRALAGPDTVTVVAQNGIEQRSLVGSYLAGGPVLPALAAVSAERVAPGEVVVHRTGTLVVPDDPAGARLASLLTGDLVSVRPVADFHTAAWRKLLSNVVVNPITALTLRRAAVLTEPDIVELATALLTEAVRVGIAEGADLSYNEIPGIIDRYRTFPPSGGSSMLYDRLAGRPLEQEHLTGALVRAADRHGIDAPLNRAVLSLLRAVRSPTSVSG